MISTDNNLEAVIPDSMTKFWIVKLLFDNNIVITCPYSELSYFTVISSFEKKFSEYVGSIVKESKNTPTLESILFYLESQILAGLSLLTEKRPAGISIILSIHQLACTIVSVNSHKHSDFFVSYWSHNYLLNDYRKMIARSLMALLRLCQYFSELTVKAYRKMSTFFLAMKKGECYYA